MRKLTHPMSFITNSCADFAKWFVTLFYFLLQYLKIILSDFPNFLHWTLSKGMMHFPADIKRTSPIDRANAISTLLLSSLIILPIVLYSSYSRSSIPNRIKTNVFKNNLIPMIPYISKRNHNLLNCYRKYFIIDLSIMHIFSDHSITFIFVYNGVEQIGKRISPTSLQDWQSLEGWLIVSFSLLTKKQDSSILT